MTRLRPCARDERSAWSILANLGVTETAAHSGPEYVALAVRLSRDPAFAAAVRAKIRDGLERSPYLDAALYARRMEEAYLEALAQKAPAVLQGVPRG